jgi:phosphonate transport system substrate-binding protein
MGRRVARRAASLPLNIPARAPAVTRRALLRCGIAAAVTVAAPVVLAARPISFGLTPVFLDSDIELLATLERYLSGRLGKPVTLVKRRTYQEITGMLLSEQLDAAWICGFPLIQYPDRLSLVAVPVYRGQPLYQSYLIASRNDPAASIDDMRGYVHAFSDPDSNSGFLVTRHLLATRGERPDTFFSRYFFTYGHRNVVRAVSTGLAQCGSVDGYVWDVMTEIEPALTEGTRVVRKSELLGFPPVACNRRLRDGTVVAEIAQALITMGASADGRTLLSTLRLDGFTAGEDALFDTIAAKYREVLSQS